MFEQIKAYCDAYGVPYQLTPAGLRVMDVSQIPGGEMRDAIGEGGLVARPAAVVEVQPEPEIEEAESETTSKHLRGPLPDGFPGKAAFEAEGYNTYAKVRAVRKAGTKVAGVGDATNAAVDEIFAQEEP